MGAKPCPRGKQSDLIEDPSSGLTALNPEQIGLELTAERLRRKGARRSHATGNGLAFAVQISFFFRVRDPVHPLQPVPQKESEGLWHRLWYGPQYPLL